MFKCFVTAAAIVLCTDKPINLTCFDEFIAEYMSRPYRPELAINFAAHECTVDGQGCCSFHGGISYYDEAQGVFICRDGSESKTCKD